MAEADLFVKRYTHRLTLAQPEAESPRKPGS
jgi:hypothetical protein